MDLMTASSNSPQRSIEARPALQRHSSTSSSDSAESSHTRRRKAIRSTKRRTSASGVQAEDDEEQSSSRRASTSSMRTSSAPLEGPVTYTPTTHRISKAKKGKRVHACEFPGCNKIFTRAEHKRRHELNHSPEASFPCDRAGCRKAFHRPDLLQRHQERHELESQTDGGAMGHRRLPSNQSSSSIAHSMITSTSMTSPPMVSIQPSHGLSIPSLLHPPSSEGYGHGQHSNTFDFVPRAPFPMYTSSISPSDDFIYPSPESSQSPLSDHYGFPHRNSMSSSSSVVDFVPPHCASPLNNSASGWAPVLPPSALPSNCNPLENDLGGFPSSSTDTSIPIPVSQLDGHEWPVIQRELATTSRAVESDHSGLEIFDLVKWQDDCLDFYWRHFHPAFPVVHQPTFSATSSALMTAIMIAIGSQYDTRTNAKERSLNLLEACAKSLAKRDDIRSQSPLSDLQTVFLLEVLAKSRSRKAEIGLSPRFRALFASLNHTSGRHWISTNPFAVLKGSTKSSSAAELQQAHSFWVNRETRRRLLLGAFVLDTQQAVLFEQQPVLFPRWPREAFRASTSTLPFPCDTELWECESIEAWAELAASRKPLHLSTAADLVTHDDADLLDLFRSRLIIAFLSTHPSPRDTGAEASFAASHEPLSIHDTRQQHRYPTLDIHAYAALQNTPIRSLLTVSGESWLFGKKLENEPDFDAAKTRLREWVASDQAERALWHASHLLRLVFHVESSDAGLEPCAEEIVAGQDHELNTFLLHQQWCIYLCALICWACAFDGTNAGPPLTNPTSPHPLLEDPFASGGTTPTTATTSTRATSYGYPLLLDPAAAHADLQHFLQLTDTDTDIDPDAMSDLPAAALTSVKGQSVRGLLEAVRTRKIEGSQGGLLNEATAVLHRLVEGRSRLSWF